MTHPLQYAPKLSGVQTMKVIVTGGAGRIGGFVVQELAQAGHEVVVLDRNLPRERVDGVRYRVGDHEDLGHIVELCAVRSAIAHLSAIPAPGTWPNTTVFRTNVMGTFNVHEAAVLTGVPLVVSTSSQSAFGFGTSTGHSCHTTCRWTKNTPTFHKMPMAYPRWSVRRSRTRIIVATICVFVRSVLHG